MEFSFVNNEGKIQSLKLKMGDNWAEKAAGDKDLNSIFALVDDKDGIVEESEFNLLKKLLEKADTLVEKSSNDKQITKKELQELSKQLKNKTIDIEDVKLETNYDVNLDDYSLEAIKERYPSDKFEIVEDGKDIRVIDKTPKKIKLIDIDTYHFETVLHIHQNETKSFISEKNADEKSLCRYFDKDGNLLWYELDNEKFYPVMDKVYKSITARKWFGLAPTTGEDFLHNIKLIPPKYINEYLTYYKQTYGQSLEDAINEEWFLDKNIKNAAFAHLEKCLKEKYDYSSDFQNENSQISNEYYTGENYSVKQDGEKLLITNNENGYQYTVDMEMLTQNLDLNEKLALKTTLQKLPAEFLADLAIELEIIQSFDNIDIKDPPDYVGGLYYNFDNKIALKSLNDIRSFVHEMGHAVDYNGSGNQSSIEKNPEFIDTFNKEMEAYIALGYVRFFRNDTVTITYKIPENSSTKGASIYATKNAREMFAECYTLLMLGECQSDSVIVNHFPKTLEAVKKHIKYVRSLPKDVRMQDRIDSWIDKFRS